MPKGGGVEIGGGGGKSGPPVFSKVKGMPNPENIEKKSGKKKQKL
jgi:hypothetical protein